MKIYFEKGDWSDKNDRKLSKEEKENFKSELFEELDRDLNEQGIQGLVKKLVKKSFGFKDSVASDTDDSDEDEQEELEDLNVAIQDLDDEIADLIEALATVKEERDKLLVKRESLFAQGLK